MTPDDPCDRATLLAAVGRLDEAEPLLRQVLQQDPAHRRAVNNLALVLLAQGRYAEAAPFYRQRHLTREGVQPKPALPFPEWRGEPLVGKRLLVFPEQGMGDQISYARFAAHYARLGADVTLLCAPELVGLFRRSLPVSVIPAVGEVSFPDPDYWARANDLVTEGGFTPGTLPSEPYLFAQGRRRGGIGIKTCGNPDQANDRRRSLPDDLAAELLSLDGAVDLDPASTGAADFQETAEIVAGLDLVISVCTSVAHLAGALGRPTWILLPFFGADWRWMRGRDDSPWYPSARLFRQGADQDWRPVLDRVKAELARPDSARIAGVGRLRTA